MNPKTKSFVRSLQKLLPAATHLLVAVPNERCCDQRARPALACCYAQIVLEVRETAKRSAGGVPGVLKAARRSVVEECGLCPTRVVRDMPSRSYEVENSGGGF